MVREPSMLSIVEVVMKSLTASLSLARRQSKIFFALYYNSLVPYFCP